MTIYLEHVHGPLFTMPKANSVVDANRVMEEMEHAMNENAALSAGAEYKRQPVRSRHLTHKDGCEMVDPETGETVNIEDAYERLLALRWTNQVMRHEMHSRNARTA